MKAFSLRRIAVALAAVALVCALAALAYTLSYRAGIDRLSGQLRDRLTVTQRSVESEIERFGYLPEVLGEDERILELLSEPTPETVRLANAYLETVTSHSLADVAYVIDTDGLTLASSNWNLPTSFVGHNYSFRPYFGEALADCEGSYYAVGVTTGVPGYFLSARIDGPQGPLGVVVVKVDMAPLEQAWARAGEMTGLADDAGVVFLSGIVDWKYRPLHPLAAHDRQLIDQERRYDAIDVAARAPLVEAGFGSSQQVFIEDENHSLALSTIRIEPQGWQLFTAQPTAPVADEARLVAVLVGLLSLLCILIGLYAYQRRQLTRWKLEQNAVLERRVAERTAELRETQDSLIHAAKLAALGRMSAAIVHEVSQPLSALDTTLAAAGMHAQKEGAAKVQSSIQTGRALLRRMQRTVKHLKSFSSRTQALPTDPISLAASVNAAIEIVAPQAREQAVEIRFSPEADHVLVAVNAVRIEQVLINLLLNAIDATATLGNSTVAISICSGADRALVEIVDSGPGIPEEIAEKITEPFFTTKKTGEGLGLGLSISRAILEDYGGTLSFAPAVGGGTLTTVSLPLAAHQPLERTS
ncbi:ATP-binding protein [Pelagibacterium sp. 26DY04]|uniref:ATP-binding protein n=1 Tax=Pelagibacterium sp. 26DY04 TaxID=2967130 RepID=UPI0028164D68|nr:ATP-binding protein [Pelagibacterium sp. 26DY04]WMT85882.1 ATP-binding protein [Pelagibacterium sp. 26DY04]